jgi:hypothetical protein
MTFVRSNYHHFMSFVVSVSIAGFLLPGSALAAASKTPLKLSVVGNHVITSSNEIYTPEGISIYGGLEAPNYLKNPANVYAQIKAAAVYWHSNTVRLQVAESDLFSHLKKGQTYNPTFIKDLNGQVNYASSLGMAVVINDQTEFTNKTRSPTKETVNFWKIVASRFKSSPDVIFDIFNEPRLVSTKVRTGPTAFNNKLPPFLGHLIDQNTGKQLKSNQAWQIWQKGGTLSGKKYVGMQTLVNTIRNEHASNLIWVEGTYGARLLPPFKYLLTGSNLVYSLHHPDLNNPKSWQQIASLSARRPVVEGEWAQYESGWAECYSDAYKNTPRYLGYLKTHGVGIIAWSLQGNSLLEGAPGLGQPTNLNTRRDPGSPKDMKKPDRLMPNYDCDSDYGEGAGLLIKDYFYKNSIQYNF